MPEYTTAKFGDLEGFYNGLFLKARSALGVESFGLAVVVIEPGTDPHPDHDHSYEAPGYSEVGAPDPLG